MGSICSRVPRRRHAVRRLSSCLALAAAAGMSGYASGASYTWTGKGTDAYWNDVNDWTPTTGYPGTTASDTAVFSGSMGQTPTLNGSNYSIGELVFSTTNNWTLDGIGSVLTLNTGGTDSGIGINALGQANGTTVNINPNLALNTNQTWEVATGATIQINGFISAVSGSTTVNPNLTITGGGTINVQGNSAVGGVIEIGTITVNSGTFDVNAGGSLDAAGLTLNNGATAIADNTAQKVDYRYGYPGTPFTTTLNGGTFVLMGNSSANSNESLGDTTLGGGASKITVSTYGGTPTLTLNSLNRAVGSGNLFVNGAGLGTAGSADGVIFNGQIVITNGVAGTGSAAVGGVPAGTVDNPNVQNAQILPYVIGEVPDTKGAIGTQTGVPDTFVALVPQSGGGYMLRPLNPADEYSHTLSSSVNGNNIYIDAPTTATTASINSLVINNANLTLGDSQTVTDAGGALLFVTNNAIQPTSGSSSPGTFVFGNASDNIVSVAPGVTGTIAAPLSGANPLTIAGPGQLNLTNANSTYSGAVSVVSGTLQFGNGAAGADGALPAVQTVTVGGQGTVNIDNVSGTPLSSAIVLNSGANVFFTQPVNNVTAPVNIQVASGASPTFVSFNNTGSITVTNSVSGKSAIDAANGRFFLIFNGGPVNFTGNVTANSVGLFTEDIFDRTSSPITFSGAANYIQYGSNIYFQTINGNSTFPNASIVVPAGAKLYTTGGSTSRDFYIDSENNNITTGASAFKNQLPPPGSIVVNGNVTAGIIYLGGNGSSGDQSAIGETRIYVQGTAANPAVLSSDLYTSFLTSTPVNTVSDSIYIGPYATASSNTGLNTFGDKISLGGYSYLKVVGPSATLNEVPAAGNTGLFWLGSGGDAFMEIGGSASGTATVNISDGSGAGANVTNYGLIFNQSATATAVMNVYNNGVLNWQPAVAAGSDLNFKMGIVSGSTSVLNVVGGQVNNSGKNSPIELGNVAGANALLNINSDGSGNVGRVVTSYLTAIASNSSAFLNFNGGELQYSNAGSTGAQTTFISGNIAGGTYIYQNGAIVGSNGQTVTIPVALQAPSGNGISNISVTAGGQGYTSAPLVQITGGGGKDASAYAIWNAATGAVTGIVVTSPGFGYTSAPTITLIDGGTPGAAGSSYPFTAATASASIAANSSLGLGGLTKVDTGTLILSKNNTYAGPTLVSAGTLQFTGASNATNAITVLTQPTASAATLSVSNTTNNNNIASAATILIGDVAPVSGTTNAGTFTLTSTAAGGFVLNSTARQTLGGFGTINGSSTVGLTVGNQTVIAPGTGNGTAVQSAVATGSGPADMSPGTPTATFNTGNKGNAAGTATGALTLTSGNAAAPMVATFAPGGTYYWKLNLGTGGGGATSSPGTYSASGANVSGAAWDALVLDSLAVPSGSSPFTIQAVSFGTPLAGGVNIGGSNTTSYTWVVAHANDASITNSLLANLALNASAMPAPASGYTYSLSTFSDPSGGSDLAVVYSPAPEPTTLMLLGPAAAAMLLRRRRRSAGALEQTA